MKKNKQLSVKKSREIANLMHRAILTSISQKTPWSINDLAFQGGTSLSLAWNSPRFSEDLDFVVRNELLLEASMKKVLSYAEQILLKVYPGINFEMKSKKTEDGRLMTFTFSSELPDFFGKVKVKTEFWHVSLEKLKNYDNQMKPLVFEGNLKALLPVATLEQIFIDKMVALGGRERIKWRDFFDVWYILSQSNFKTPNFKSDDFKTKMNNTLSLYKIEEDKMIKNWKDRSEMGKDILMEDAVLSLKPWVEEELWQKLYPETVEKMVCQTQEWLKNISENIPFEKKEEHFIKPKVKL